MADADIPFLLTLKKKPGDPNFEEGGSYLEILNMMHIY